MAATRTEMSGHYRTLQTWETSLIAMYGRPGSGTRKVPSKDPGILSIVIFQVSITSTPYCTPGLRTMSR